MRPALGIDRDTNIDALDQTSGARAGIVPGVERGLRPAGSRDCAHQADTWVFARSPLVDISVVADSGGDDFGMCRCHALGHGASHPAQCLGRTCLSETFGGPLDVGPCGDLCEASGVPVSISIGAKRPLIGASRSNETKLYSDIRVRSFILNGAPFGFVPISRPPH
jgi:hypothetical protein